MRSSPFTVSPAVLLMFLLCLRAFSCVQPGYFGMESSLNSVTKLTGNFLRFMLEFCTFTLGVLIFCSGKTLRSIALSSFFQLWSLTQPSHKPPSPNSATPHPLLHLFLPLSSHHYLFTINSNTPLSLLCAPLLTSPIGFPSLSNPRFYPIRPPFIPLDIHLIHTFPLILITPQFEPPFIWSGEGPSEPSSRLRC